MKKLLFFLIMLTIYGCNKPKTVLICGDHVCVNKAEAEQYFEDNLTLEVRIVDSKQKKEIDLVELNLKSNSEGKKEITMLNKNQTRKEIKVLSNEKSTNSGELSETIKLPESIAPLLLLSSNSIFSCLFPPAEKDNLPIRLNNTMRIKNLLSK